MTRRDRDRLAALRKAEKKLIRQRQTTAELDISVRQVKRLLNRLMRKGDEAVVHRPRGRPSKRISGGNMAISQG